MKIECIAGSPCPETWSTWREAESGAAEMKRQPSAPCLVALAEAVTSPIHAEDRANCPKTVPSGEILGEPFPASAHWYGSETLAVILRPDGIWRGMGPEYNYRDKLFWWSFGFKPGSESGLKVSATSWTAIPPKRASRHRRTPTRPRWVGGRCWWRWSFPPQGVGRLREST